VGGAGARRRGIGGHGAGVTLAAPFYLKKLGELRKKLADRPLLFIDVPPRVCGTSGPNAYTGVERGATLAVSSRSALAASIGRPTRYP
jgi:hypothetical protein